MALDAILIAQINANTQAINKLNEDARKTSELPLMPVLDVNSLIRVEFGGISKHVKASQFAPPNAEFLEYIFNKQNDLSPDGTGIKYPTVDAVIDGLLLQKEYTDTLVADLVKVDKTNFKDIYQTGILRIDLDVSVLTVSPADTLTITACNNLLFVNEIAPDTPANLLGDYLKSFGNKSFVANGTNTPLPVNTRGIFYVGLDKLGNQVYRTAKVYDQDIAYLARMVVENNGGVYTIVLNRYMPDLANNRINNRDRFVIASGSLVPSGATSISFGNRGMSFYKNSINYATNKFDPNYLALADSVNPTPANFLFYLPNITNLAVSLATSTTINPTQWYTAGGALGGTAVNGTNYQVYKVYLSVTGTIIIQTKASTSNAPEAGVNAIFANRESALAGLTSTVFPALTPAGDYIALGTFFLRAGTAVNGSQMNDPNDFYFQAFTQTSSSSSVGVTEHDLLSGKNTNPAFQHVTNTEKVDWNTAFADRYKWDGSASGLDALLGRTSLGGTTIGQNLFTSPNPSAVRFLRANADNSISWLDANTFRTAIGAGTGNGTGNGSVTSVDLLAPTGLAVTGNPITTAGTLVLAYQAGYSIPTDAKQANWDTAFGWGNHASAGYVHSSEVSVNPIDNTIVRRSGSGLALISGGYLETTLTNVDATAITEFATFGGGGVIRKNSIGAVKNILGLDNGFILNQNASAQSANMWISGDIKAKQIFLQQGFGANLGSDWQIGGIDGDRFYVFNNVLGRDNIVVKASSGNTGINTANPLFEMAVAPTVGAGDVNGIGVIYHPDGALNRTRARLGITGFQGLLELKDSLDVSTVRIIANGNSFFNGGAVGLGTQSPNGTLDVYGIIAIKGVQSFDHDGINLYIKNPTGIYMQTPTVFTNSISNSASIFTSDIYTGGENGIRMLHDSAYISFYNSAQSVRSGYLQMVIDGTCTWMNERNSDLAFGTNSLVRMRVRNTGNVTIGDIGDNGSDKLQVAGSGIFQNSLIAGGNRGANYISVLGAESGDIRLENVGSTASGILRRLRTSWYSDTFDYNVYRGLGTDITKSSWSYNGTDLMVLNNNGILQVTGIVSANNGRTVFRDNSIEEHFTDGNASISVNFLGYQSTGAHYRDFNVYDGKGNLKLSVQGSTGLVAIPSLGNGSATQYVTVSPSGTLGGAVLPKKYIVQLQQNGGSAPTIVATLASTLSDTPVISYIGTGQYRITSADFSNGSKMNIQLNQGVSVAEGYVRARKGSGAWIDLNTYNTSQLLSNDVISIQYCTIDVEIYP